MRILALVSVFLSAHQAWADVDFRRQVYPILHDYCFRCHQGTDAKSGVRLDTRAEMLTRTRTPRGAEDPVLIHAITTNDAEARMPPTGKRLNADQVALLRAWINEGVAWDESLLPSDEQKKGHWAFQSVVRPSIPPVRSQSWVRNPIDAFIAKEHERKELQPTREALRRTLIRRLSIDLLGLPPTPDDVTAFVNDDRADAYERWVDRFLSSPHYGERWGRHWLDLARYADSEGYESDHLRPHAWRYRDWVVQAFNTDMPFDRFILEQLAGDEITPYRDEHLIATGFLAAARLSSNEEDKARQLNDMYVDIVNVTGNTFLGLTVQCAQCHDHKFDPISQKDYYRLQGFFLNGMPYNFALRDPAGWKRHHGSKPPEYDDVLRLKDRLFNAARAKLEEKAWQSLTSDQVQALKTPNDRRTPAQHALAVEATLAFQWSQGLVENAMSATDKPLYAELKKRLTAIEATMIEPPQTFGFYSPVTSPHTITAMPMRGFYPPPFDANELSRQPPFLLVAGDAKQRGPKLERGWPALFGPTPTIPPTRTELAQWLTNPKHPLTARVWVNRVWQFHFGRGLVDTPSDFGVRGHRPSHPELLDWLAAEFMQPAHGPAWSVKHLHRLIVTSATYRQAAQAEAANGERDPDNVWLTRWKPRRVEAEVVRDTLLSISGELQLSVGGVPDPDENTSLRRGLYQLMKRQKPPAGLTLFDGPTAAAESCPKRSTTVTPLHALYLLNNPFTLARQKAFTARVQRLAGDDTTRQIDTAFILAINRMPTAQERRLIAKHFAQHPQQFDLAELCSVLLAATELFTLE